MLSVVVENLGNETAEDVQFEFSPAFEWPNGLPTPLKSGMRFFPPQSTLSFYLTTAAKALRSDSKIPPVFEIQVSYNHPALGRRSAHIYYIDIASLSGSAIPKSGMDAVGRELVRSIDDLQQQMVLTRSVLSQIASIAAPTGLQISHSALQNLSALKQGSKDFTKIAVSSTEPNVFEEVLRVPTDVAHNLSFLFQGRDAQESLEQILGHNQDLLDTFHKYFDPNT